MAESKQLNSGNKKEPRISNMINTDELFNAQSDTADRLRSANRSLADFPDLSVKILVIANEARTAHLKTIAMMTKFGITLNNLVENTIPLVLKNITSEQLLDRAFALVIEYAQQMKTECHTTIKRYESLKSEVTELVKTIESDSECRKKEYEELKGKKDTQIESLKNLEADLKSKLNDLQEASTNTGTSDTGKGSGTCTNQTMDKDQPNENKTDSIKQGFNFVYNKCIKRPINGLFQGVKNLVTFGIPVEEIKDCNSNIPELEIKGNEISEKLSRVNNEFNLLRKENNESKPVEEVFAGANALNQVIDNLVKVKKNFESMELLWQNMVNEVHKIQQKLRSRNAIDVNQVTETFRSFEEVSLDLAETFRDYVKTSERNIPSLYRIE